MVLIALSGFVCASLYRGMYRSPYRRFPDFFNAQCAGNLCLLQSGLRFTPTKHP
jgi:hypothetical protein